MSAVCESGEGVGDRHSVCSRDASAATDAVQIWGGETVLHPHWEGQGRVTGRSGHHHRRQPAGEGAVHSQR